MAYSIIGSSNIYKHYNVSKFRGYKNYSMIKCTDVNNFEVKLSNSDDKFIVISVIENFIDKEVSSGLLKTKGEKADIMKLVENAVQVYSGVIKEAATRRPKAKFSVASPMLRPSLKWYQDSYDDISNLHNDVIKSLNLDNVTLVEMIPVASQKFEKDGVHLVPDSALKLIDYLLRESENFFETDLVSLSDDDGTETEETEETESTSEISLRIKNLEDSVRNRRCTDNLIFARIREEMDTLTNRNKEDRVIITGLTSKTVPPVGLTEKKTWLKGVVVDILDQLAPNLSSKIAFINQGRNQGKMIPLVEVRLDSAASASEVRKAFADKRKREGKDFTLGRVFMANCVGLATRVRVDVLKALALKLASPTQDAYVTPFTSRPMLHLKGKDGKSGSLNLTFVDAVARFGDGLTEDNLSEAYRRAGTAFKGQLAQHFVVLKDWGEEIGKRAPGTKPYYPRGGGDQSRKRPRSEDSSRGGPSGTGRWQRGKTRRS